MRRPEDRTNKPHIDFVLIDKRCIYYIKVLKVLVAFTELIHIHWYQQEIDNMKEPSNEKVVNIYYNITCLQGHLPMAAQGS